MAAATSLYLLLLLAVSTAQTSSSKLVQAMSMRDDHRPATVRLDDWGHASNCGPVPFNFSWYPKVLNPYSSIILKLDYIAAHNLKSLVASFDVYLYGETTPFFGYDITFQCDQLKGYLPCPMKKGLAIHTTQDIGSVPATSRYPGKYVIVADARNEDKEQMFCLNMTVTISLEDYNAYNVVD